MQVVVRKTFLELQESPNEAPLRRSRSLLAAGGRSSRWMWECPLDTPWKYVVFVVTGVGGNDTVVEMIAMAQSMVMPSHAATRASLLVASCC